MLDNIAGNMRGFYQQEVENVTALRGLLPLNDIKYTYHILHTQESLDVHVLLISANLLFPKHEQNK